MTVTVIRISGVVHVTDTRPGRYAQGTICGTGAWHSRRHRDAYARAAGEDVTKFWDRCYGSAIARAAEHRDARAVSCLACLVLLSDRRSAP